MRGDITWRRKYGFFSPLFVGRALGSNGVAGKESLQEGVWRARETPSAPSSAQTPQWHPGATPGGSPVSPSRASLAVENAAGGSSCLRQVLAPVKSPPNSLHHRLWWFFSPPRRAGVGIIDLWHLGAACECTGCCVGAGGWSSTWLLTSAPGSCEGCEPSSSSSSSLQLSPETVDEHREASWPRP